MVFSHCDATCLRYVTMVRQPILWTGLSMRRDSAPTVVGPSPFGGRWVVRAHVLAPLSGAAVITR